MDKVYWTLVEVGEWRLHLAATEKGLCYVGSPDAPLQELVDWTRKRLQAVEPLREDGAMRVYAAALRAYLLEEQQSFDLPLDLRGTEFQQSVWQQLLTIPHGATCSYQDIAERLGRTTAVRAVGTAIGANPLLIVVPCHRVIGKNGRLTGYRGGMEAKAQLLKLEGALQGTP